MATGKRASMREGPLAALFRKTAEDTEGGSAGSEPASSTPGTPAGASEPASSTPGTPARGASRRRARRARLGLRLRLP